MNIRSHYSHWNIKLSARVHLSKFLASHKMISIRDADSVLQVNNFDSHWHLVHAQPPNLLVMSSFEKVLQAYKEKTNLLLSEQSILQNEIDRLTKSQIILKTLFLLPLEVDLLDHVARLREFVSI